MKTYTIRKNEGVKFIAIPAIDEMNLVYHGFSTKMGGVSVGRFKSMNLSLNSGEDKDLVEINRCMYAKALSAGNPEIYTVRQMHGTRVIRVETKEHPAEEYRQAQADAIVTNQPGIAIGVLTADCVPILVLDPKNKAIGAIHAGREGTMMKIVSHVIQKMETDFGSSPENLQVAVGPCIETKCYEVGKEIAQSVKETFNNRNQFLIHENGSYFLNLRKMNHHQLLECGVQEEHIFHVSMCTACHSRTFYSYRKSHGKETGRMMAFLMIKEE